MSQQAKLEKSSRMLARSVRKPTARRRARAAHVVVAWTAVSDGGGLVAEPTQVELEARLGSPASTTWTSREPADSGWAEALSTARCTEVLLTAPDDDLRSRHLVFELAGLLTHKLLATRPLIRVRFVPSAERVQQVRGAGEIG